MPCQLLTHSQMGDFKRCRRRCYWSYEAKLRPITDAKALRMGSAYHEGLDCLKKNQGIDAAIESVRKCYDGIAIHTEDQAAAFDVECETVVAMVNGYHWRWGNSPLMVIASEQSFHIPLINPETGGASTVFDLAGKIDGIVKLEDGRLAVLEHKLQADNLAPDGDYWRRMQIDSQITLYVYAARKLGYDVATVLYDVARKPTIRPEKVPLCDSDGIKIVIDANGDRVRTKDGKKWRQTGDTELGYVLQSRPMTCEEWINKLTEDIGNYPEIYFARREIPRLDQDIEEFMAEVWDIQKVLREAQNNNRWFRTVHRDTCGFCPYFGLCSNKFDPGSSVAPEGFAFVTNIHPELGEENGISATT